MSAPELLPHRLATVEAMAELLPGVVVINRIPDGGPAWMSPRGRLLLGITAPELAALDAATYHSRFFNAADVAEYLPKIMDLLQRDEPGAYCTFFQQVRTLAGRPWEWYSVASSIFQHDAAGAPTHLLTFAMPVDPRTDVDAKVGRLLEEKNFRRAHATTFAGLTRREREVLRQVALGLSAPEIAGALCVSATTVETHRRNLRAKLNAESGYDLVRFAQAFDLV